MKRSEAALGFLDEAIELATEQSLRAGGIMAGHDYMSAAEADGQDWCVGSVRREWMDGS